MTSFPAARPAAGLAQHGIARVATGHFELGGYRHTNPTDAVAQAKRSRDEGL